MVVSLRTAGRFGVQVDKRLRTASYHAPQDDERDDELPDSGGVLDTAEGYAQSFVHNKFQLASMAAGATIFTSPLQPFLDTEAQRQNTDEMIEGTLARSPVLDKAIAKEMGIGRSEVSAEDFLSVVKHEAPDVHEALVDAGTATRSGLGIGASFVPTLLAPHASFLFTAPAAIALGIAADNIYCTATGADDNRSQEIVTDIERGLRNGKNLRQVLGEINEALLVGDYVAPSERDENEDALGRPYRGHPSGLPPQLIARGRRDLNPTLDI